MYTRVCLYIEVYPSHLLLLVIRRVLLGGFVSLLRVALAGPVGPIGCDGGGCVGCVLGFFLTSLLVPELPLG